MVVFGNEVDFGGDGGLWCLCVEVFFVDGYSVVVVGVDFEDGVGDFGVIGVDEVC